jgi:uncharacterized membrane protein
MSRFGWGMVTLLSAVCAGIAAHLYVLNAYPAKRMREAVARIGQDGKRHNFLVNAPPVTPASRGVVRPSPDLIYSVCIYDLSGGDVEIEMSPQADYHSLSLYDLKTNNFFVINDRETGDRPYVLRLTRAKIKGEKAGSGETVLVPPTPVGLALIRRLAATPAMLETAQKVRLKDRCEPVEAQK